MPAKSQPEGQRIYGYRSEACRSPIKGFWSVPEAVPAVGSVAAPRASRGTELLPVPAAAAVVHRAKSQYSSRAEWSGVYLFGAWRKEKRLHDRSAPAWLPKPVRRQSADL